MAYTQVIFYKNLFKCLRTVMAVFRRDGAYEVASEMVLHQGKIIPIRN